MSQENVEVVKAMKRAEPVDDLEGDW